MKKTLYTLSVNDYAPEITALTFPLLKNYAKKIDAEFYVIKERKFPDFPCPYEKFQISELSQKRGDEWSIFIDADALIHPDFWDITSCVNKDMTISVGSDFSPQRFKPDKYFRRDGRFIGKGNWFMAGSDWTIEDLMAPLHDLTKEQAAAKISPLVFESSTIIEGEHLIDDFTVSRNISRYGLKHILVREIIENVQKTSKAVVPEGYLYHVYLNNVSEKVHILKKMILIWLYKSMLKTSDPSMMTDDDKLFNDSVARLSTWDGSVDWENLVSILPQGKKVARTIYELGIDFKYKPLSRLSYEAKQVFLVYPMNFLPDSKEKEETIISIHSMPKNASVKDFINTLPVKNHLLATIKKWGLEL